MARRPHEHVTKSEPPGLSSVSPNPNTRTDIRLIYLQRRRPPPPNITGHGAELASSLYDSSHNKPYIYVKESLRHLACDVCGRRPFIPSSIYWARPNLPPTELENDRETKQTRETVPIPRCSDRSVEMQDIPAQKYDYVPTWLETGKKKKCYEV